MVLFLPSLLCAILVQVGTAFVSPTFLTSSQHQVHSGVWLRQKSTIIVHAAGGGEGKKKRRRRKRKDDVTTTSEASSPVANKELPVEAELPPPPPAEPITVEDVSARQAKKVENLDKPGGFKFDRSEALALGIQDADDDDDIPNELKVAASPQNELKIQERGAIELPSMQDAIQKKKREAEAPAVQKEEVKSEKIDRSDINRFKQLLEVEPNADSDKSFFVDEEYNNVSALLGEGAQTFLGLPLAILQVGHFILALGLILMAFVQYPGFPLTNLPTPLRGALQGGLGTVYLINTVLAVLSVFEAAKRDQPQALWAIKTFTVGGLSYDQLTQLPTKEQKLQAKNKGKRRR